MTLTTQRGATARPAASPVDPLGAAGVSKEIIVLSDPNGARAEAMRALRTYIMAQHVGQGRRALAVCAPSDGVGCSFVAANLAVGLSQLGVNTLLIDGDLRRPGVDALIPSPEGTEGLRQCLSSPHASFGEYMVSEALPHLAVLYAGGAAANAQELLGGARFRSLMDVCAREFDATIIDTPPANTCADARLISTVAGYALVVARKDRSLVEDVKTFVRELEVDHAQVVGTVLNAA